MDRARVPEASIDEDGDTTPYEGDVDGPSAAARHRPSHPISMTASVQQTTNRHLRRRVGARLPLHPRGHRGAAGGDLLCRTVGIRLELLVNQDASPE